MTQETIDLIIKWFEHIQQLATDRKTLTGVVMDRQHCLDEIAAMASRCKQFVEEYRDEQEPIDEEKLDKLALEYWENNKYEGEEEWECDAIGAFKAGYRKAL